MSGPGALLLVAAMAVAALAAGRLFVGAFGGVLYRRFDAAAGAASLLAGSAVITLLSVALSGVGFPTRDLPLLVAAAQLVPLAWCARRGRLDVLRPTGHAWDWATLLAPAALSAWLGLLPVARAGGFAFGNDTYTYGAFSEWLQGHAFAEAARWEAQSPVTGIPALWQGQGYDLGIAHLLALVQAAVRPASALLVYPQTSAFALVLLVAALWLAARQLLRVSSAWAGAVGLLFAVVPHPLYWGHHNGFLQQAYALPFVAFALVLLARSASPGRWRLSTAALVALPFAFVVSVYLPLLPVLGGAASAALTTSLARARRRRRLPRLALLVGGVCSCVAVYAGRDLVGALSPLHRFATSVAGAHVPWTPVDFAGFALGTRVPAPGWVNLELAPWSALHRWLAPVYAAFVIAGLWQCVRRPRTRPFAVAALLIAVLAAYFALAVRDPWRGGLGHTWNLFKLAQWGWPFVLLLAVAGAFALRRGRRPWRAAALGLAFAVPAAQVGVHWPWSTRLGDVMRETLPGTSVGQLGALRQRIQSLPPGTLLLVGRPANTSRWLATAVSLLAYPRAIVGDWTDSGSVSNHPGGGEALYAQLLGRWDGPNVVPILAGFVPFQADGVEPLGGGIALLRQTPEPRIVHVVNPSGLDGNEGAARPGFGIGKGRTKIVVFAPRGGPAALVLAVRPYHGRPGTRLVGYVAGGDYSHRSVRLASEGAPQAVLPLTGETSLRVPLTLPQGLSTVVLVVDEGRGELDAREPVTVVGLSLQPAGPAPAGD